MRGSPVYVGKIQLGGNIFCLVNTLYLHYNPSVTAAPCHLPLHKGGLPDSNAFASFGRKSIVFCLFRQCRNVSQQYGYLRD